MLFGIMLWSPPRFSPDGVGGATVMRPAATSTTGTKASVNGSMMVVPPARGASQDITGAEVVDRYPVPTSVPSAVTAASPIRSTW